jgi:hypothetical protein
VLKHQWLYLNKLNTQATGQKLVVFYVEQHNKHLPHVAFHGQTPDEMYFDTGTDIPQQLAAAKVAARQARLTGNRAVRGQRCSEPVRQAVVLGQGTARRNGRLAGRVSRRTKALADREAPSRRVNGVRRANAIT